MQVCLLLESGLHADFFFSFFLSFLSSFFFRLFGNPEEAISFTNPFQSVALPALAHFRGVSWVFMVLYFSALLPSTLTSLTEKWFGVTDVFFIMKRGKLTQQLCP